MSQGVGDEGRIGKSRFAERGSDRRVRLHNNGNTREECGVRSESKGNDTELRDERARQQYGKRGGDGCQCQWSMK